MTFDFAVLLLLFIPPLTLAKNARAEGPVPVVLWHGMDENPIRKQRAVRNERAIAGLAQLTASLVGVKAIIAANAALTASTAVALAALGTDIYLAIELVRSSDHYEELLKDFFPLTFVLDDYEFTVSAKDYTPDYFWKNITTFWP